MSDYVDSEAIIAATFPASVQKALGRNYSGIHTGLVADLQTRQIGAYTGVRAAQDCKNARQPGTGAQKAQAIGSTALTGFGALAPFIVPLQAIPVVGQIIGGIAIGLKYITGIFQHHAIAVAREQTALCSIVPQINEEFLQLDQDYTAGNLSFQEASLALDQIDSQFRQAVAPITTDNASQCNAGCVIGREVDALVVERKQIYAGQVSIAYYVKHYWWAGLIALAAWFFFSHRVTVKGG